MFYQREAFSVGPVFYAETKSELDFVLMHMVRKLGTFKVSDHESFFFLQRFNLNFTLASRKNTLADFFKTSSTLIYTSIRCRMHEVDVQQNCLMIWRWNLWECLKNWVFVESLIIISNAMKVLRILRQVFVLETLKSSRGQNYGLPGAHKHQKWREKLREWCMKLLLVIRSAWSSHRVRNAEAGSAYKKLFSCIDQLQAIKKM